MLVKELIQHLRCFDEEHHVIVAVPDRDYPDIEKCIAEVKFDGRYCIIKTEN